MCVFSPSIFFLNMVCNFHCSISHCFHLAIYPENYFISLKRDLPNYFFGWGERAVYYCIVVIFQNLFHWLLTDWDWRGYQFLNIAYNVAMNNLVPISFCIYRMCLWDRFLEVGFLDQRERSSVVLLEVANSQYGNYFIFPLLLSESVSFSNSLVNPVSCYFKLAILIREKWFSMVLFCFLNLRVNILSCLRMII